MDNRSKLFEVVVCFALLAIMDADILFYDITTRGGTNTVQGLSLIGFIAFVFSLWGFVVAVFAVFFMIGFPNLIWNQCQRASRFQKKRT
jgi:predicted membrane protein